MSYINTHELEECYDYRICKYGIYHTYWYDMDDNKYRLFIDPKHIESYFYTLNGILLSDDLPKEMVLEFITKNKFDLDLTLDLDGLYAKL